MKITIEEDKQTQIFGSLPVGTVFMCGPDVFLKILHQGDYVAVYLNSYNTHKFDPFTEVEIYENSHLILKK